MGLVGRLANRAPIGSDIEHDYENAEGADNKASVRIVYGKHRYSKYAGAHNRLEDNTCKKLARDRPSVHLIVRLPSVNQVNAIV